ncbi:glycosyltransferase [Schleiferilactobacillus shenzhenensis]|uniref:Glycosyltransferase 2-like domain-containing protein n=1 Tax=Schleiferilactobacillus shenzhenensis LY-73 TaxID=1231336 RepID=U4TSR0_9LACO|nr:glycosyltransferase [Schleiferilactobacillus shenzhenensis]ERL64517.1 hypothetical protein L248_0928 [Schleiferilactobacillus shenzhenensis LY-73]
MIVEGLTVFFELALYIFLTYILLSMMLGIMHAPKLQSEFLENTEEASDGLFYYIIIPTLNEGRIIQHTLNRLLQNDFNGIVIVVDDASADDTVHRASSVADGDMRILIVRRQLPHAQIGKGDSLNQAMDWIRHDSRQHQRDLSKVVVGVLDADGGLSNNAFFALNHFFTDSGHDICQLRVKMDGPFTNSLQAAQDLEFFTVNNEAQNMRMHTHTVGLSGNGQFFRLLPVVRAIGWHPWGNALLDDYELTLRLMLHGITVHYIDSAYASQQALTSPYKLMRQRSRWVQGNLDCMRYFRPVIQNRHLSYTQKAGILFFLAQPWINLGADLSLFGLFGISLQHIVNIMLARPETILHPR